MTVGAQWLRRAAVGGCVGDGNNRQRAGRRESMRSRECTADRSNRRPRRYERQGGVNISGSAPKSDSLFDSLGGAS